MIPFRCFLERSSWVVRANEGGGLNDLNRIPCVLMTIECPREKTAEDERWFRFLGGDC